MDSVICPGNQNVDRRMDGHFNPFTAGPDYIQVFIFLFAH